jgi:tripartite-type tricarboxylate transporter receptor subunit TctC
LLAPAGTPAAVVSRLNATIVKVLAQADIRKKISDQGAEVYSETPEQFASFIQAEGVKWGKVVRDSGASVD